MVCYKILNHYWATNPCWPSYLLVSNKPGEKDGDFKVGQCIFHCQDVANLKHSDHFLVPKMLGMIYVSVTTVLTLRVTVGSR